MGLTLPEKMKVQRPLLVHVCAHRQRGEPETLCFPKKGLAWVWACALRGEKINYLQTKTPDNATTVQVRATALGKQPHYFF